MPSDTLLISSWRSALYEHAKKFPFTAIGLTLALLALAGLLLQGLWLAITEEANISLRWALMGGLAAFAATSLGALPALALKGISTRIEDSMLGFAAGMMLAASSFSLILPGIEASTALMHTPIMGALVVVFGMALGVLLMLGLDQFTPHEHDKTGPCGPGHENCDRVLLFVFAIALHNLPEGMAIGVSFAQEDLNVGIPFTTAIALQDIPEGLAVALALIAAWASAALVKPVRSSSDQPVPLRPEGTSLH